MSQLVITPIKGIPLVREGDLIPRLILDGLVSNDISLQDNDIIVIAQKIISKSEGRMVRLSDIAPSERAIQLAEYIEKDPRLVELILRESNEVLRTKPGTIIVEHRLGFVCANAGIDHSNVHELDPESNNDHYLLLPVDPDGSARIIRDEIKAETGKNVGIVIIDSHGRAWRSGITGTAIGIAGVPALVDLRGTEDLFGYSLRVTQVASVDELAAAASLMMGEANEGIPAVHVWGFPYDLRESSMKELLRTKQDDLFR
ncbi:MAG: coenzyme F420-0:L-glutamate ligase [Anaerolineae bacterium]|nr:coenzyme F420-0:L-glutamate ligase [Anaerolineae bacterium]